MTHDIAASLAAARSKALAGQLDDAAALLHEILASEPGHGEALEGLGHLAVRLGDPARAADYLLQAAASMPMSVEQLQWAAQICQHAQRHEDAVALFERVLAQAPRHIEALHGAAMSLIQLDELQRALVKLDQLCKIQPHAAEAHYNRGALLGKLERYEDELNAYRQTIALKPRFGRAYVNLGVALRDLGRFDEALQQFRKALSIDPDDAGARTNRSQTNLLRGEFEHGWREYEWRWRDGTSSHGLPANMLWTGQPLTNKTVLVHHEQGFGDTLQFVRFVDRLTAQGAHVVLRVQDALLPVLGRYPGAAEGIGESATLPRFDYHVPMLTLPFALKLLRETDFATAGPYLQADAALASQWDDLITAEPRRPRVGLVWSGSRTHLNDVNRSIPLDRLLPWFDTDAAFISLQYDVRERDRACFAQLEQRGVLRDVAARLVTFADTAALIARLDVVITVDTAVAHLAGALGKPVWIALPFMPDWRWQLARSDSPWYPGVRLFRQTTRNDWHAVVADVRAALGTWRPD